MWVVWHQPHHVSPLGPHGYVVADWWQHLCVDDAMGRWVSGAMWWELRMEEGGAVLWDEGE